MLQHLETIQVIVNALVEEDYELAQGLTELHLGFFQHRQAMTHQEPEKFPSAYHDLAMAHHEEAEKSARIIPTKDLKRILPPLNNVLKACAACHVEYTVRGQSISYGRIQLSEQKTITAFYEEDHDRLDELFKTFQASKQSDFAKAKEAFKEFKIGLQRHILWEEELLFPMWEEKTGMIEDGPTPVMRFEHDQIKTLLEAIHQKMEQQNLDTDQDEQALVNLLSSHNRKEERALYPAIDNVTSADERATVFSNMKSIPEERYNACCNQH